jgi:hypothetical protein
MTPMGKSTTPLGRRLDLPSHHLEGLHDHRGHPMMIQYLAVKRLYTYKIMVFSGEHND